MSAAENKAVFLSYASQDAAAVARIAEALRAAGVEVWFDQNELVGGDAWDAKIRGQIAACALFVPVISANTQARREGYFRLEWKLGAQRTHMIADGTPFLLPVVIDATRDAEALVPAEFKAVQWTRLPAGEGGTKLLAAFCARVSRVLAGAAAPEPAAAPVPASAAREKPRRGWLGALATLGVLVVGAAGAWLLTRPPQAIPPAPPPAAGTSTEPVGEVAQLVARARSLRSLDGLTRERLGAAEELLKQAVRLAPTDPDGLAVAAQVDALMRFRNWDRSEERRQSAVQRAARAMALAPERFEARRAQAMVAAFALRTADALRESEATYRRLGAERPGDVQVLEELGAVLEGLRNYEEAARVFTAAGRPLLAGNVYRLAGQFRQARQVADTLLAEKRNVGALVLKAYVDLIGFNDRAAAKATVNLLTPTELSEDDAAGIALRVAVLSADAPALLKLLEPFPHPFVSISGVSYPRRYWTGLAREWLKQPEAARIEWRGALQSIEERLKANAADSDALSWAAMLNVCLGDLPATEQALRVYRNYRDLTTGYWDFNYCLPLLRMGGRDDEVIDRLAKTLREQPNGPLTTAIVYAWARFSPELDTLRGQPRFERLLREMRRPEALPFADEQAQSVAGPGVGEKSVAVLAFANLSDDKSNEFFSDGISEELGNVLGRVPGLRVAASTSAFSFKGKAVPVAEIARQLGVSYVVEGAVRKMGTTLRINAKLVKAADGFQVWSSGNLEREARNIFAVQDEIAGLIAQALSLKLGASAQRTKAGVNPEAFDYYVQARQQWNRRTPEGYARAEELLERALALEPDFARAHAALADVWIIQGQDRGDVARFGDRDSPLQRRIIDRIRHALSLEPDSAEAHASLGNALWNGWSHADAEQSLRRAITLNRSYASAHQWLGRVLMDQGRMDEAIAALQLAMDLDPLSSRIADNRALASLLAGRFSEALTLYDRALGLRPDSVQAATQKAITLAEMGRRRAAAELLGTITPAMWASRTQDSRVEVLARAQVLAEAEQRLAAFDSARKDRARLLVLLGRTAEGLAALNPDAVLATTIHQWLWLPALDPIRSDPRFGQFLETLGLTEAHVRAQAWRQAHPPERKAME